MTAQHFMQNPGEDPVDISAYVLLPPIGEDGFRLQTHAEQGSVGSSEIVFDDPAGDFYPIGLNAYRVFETASEADDPLLFSGGFAIRRQSRGPYRTGASRRIAAEVGDANGGLSRYVIRAGEGGNRPAETETERMEWLFTTSGMALHWDISTSILDLGSTVMSKNDYTDSTPQQVLDDMAQQTGKNYYVFIDGSVDGTEALLVYGFDSGTHLTSDLRFSNVETDADDITTFYAGLDWELSIDPSRIASYVAVRFANGRVDKEDAATADEFSRSDRVMDGSYIKTASAATARALKYLQELDSEELILSGTVYLPASKASQFRAGMRVQMKATHLTGLEDFTWVRLVNVTITQVATDDQVIGYALAFEGNFEVSSATCELIIEGLTAQSEGPHPYGGIDFGPQVGDAIAGSDDDTLTIALFVTYSAEVSLHSVSVDSPWVAGAEKPGDIGGSHFETLAAYMAGTVSTPEWDWTNYTYGWHQVSVVIPTSSTAWEQEADIDGLGNITWDTPPTPGNLLYLARIGEGPSYFNGPPLGADWTLIYDQPVDESGIMQVYVACCPDDPDDLESGEAGSSWWAHCFEVAIT